MTQPFNGNGKPLVTYTGDNYTPNVNSYPQYVDDLTRDAFGRVNFVARNRQQIHV